MKDTICVLYGMHRTTAASLKMVDDLLCNTVMVSMTTPRVVCEVILESFVGQ